MSDYSADSIIVLPGLEGVRRRPRMFIGDLGDEGLHVVLCQLVDHAVEAHQHGTASYLRVAIDGAEISIEDDGDGIPVDRVPCEPELTTLELVMTRLHGGGLHAFGFPVANALSERLDAEVWRDGHHWQQRFARGAAVSLVRDLGPTQRTGTRITFRPDRSILGPCAWNRAAIALRLREIAATCPTLTTILDHDAVRYPDGIADHARYQARGARALAAPVRITGVHSDVTIDVALLWTAAARGQTWGLVGTQPSHSGTHLRGLVNGLLGAFVALAPGRFSGVYSAALAERIAAGLVAIVHVTLRDPRFSDIRREALVNPEVQPAVTELVAGELHRRLLDDASLRELLLARMPATG